MPRLAFMTLVGVSITTLCAMSEADQTTLLDDLTFPGRWRADDWVKAPGAARPVADAPDEVADGGSLRSVGILSGCSRAWMTTVLERCEHVVRPQVRYGR